MRPGFSVGAHAGNGLRKIKVALGHHTYIGHHRITIMDGFFGDEKWKKSG
jgi:hypothetical protein